MDEANARRTVEALLGSYRRFNDLAADVFSDGSYQQAVEFRKLVGHILGTISVGFFMPLFQQFPALKPEEFKGPYEPLPLLPRETALELRAALEELGSRLSFIEAGVCSSGTPNEVQAVQSEVADLNEVIRLGQAFADRAASRHASPGH